MPDKRVVAPIVILLVAAAVTATLVLTRPDAEQREAPAPTLFVNTVVAQPQLASLTIQARGTVGPRVETTIVSEVSGLIVDRASSFVAGGFFRAGETLLTIDPRNYRAEVARAEAAVAQARTAIARELVLAGRPAQDFQRLQELTLEDVEMEELALRKPGLAQALAELESARAGLDKVRGDLDRTRIRAPYDGLVRARRADIGQFVAAGTPLAETFAVDRAEVRLPLKQNDLPFLALPPPGAEQRPEGALPVTLRADIGGRESRWTGRLVRTEGVFDARSQVLYGVVEVDDPYRLRADDGAEPLRLGTFVTAELPGRALENVVRLPRHTLTPGDRVWIVTEDDTIAPRDVTVARTDDDWVYVTHGLADGDRVCVTPIANPLAGMPVRIVDDAEALARRRALDAPGDAGP